MIGAGGAEGAIDASSILKPALARGELRLIGATNFMIRAPFVVQGVMIGLVGALIPLAIYIIFSKFLVKGLTVGSIK